MSSRTRLWAGVVMDTLRTAAGEHTDVMRRDFRVAWRSLCLRHNVPFLAAALLSLALGIGAVTAIYAIVHAVLIAPLPYSEPEEIVYLTEINPSLGITEEFAVSVPTFVTWQQTLSSSVELAAVINVPANLGGCGEPERVRGMKASAALWTMLGVPVRAGRTFLPEEDRPGAAPVALISEGLWRRRFAGSTAVLGDTILINGAPVTVLGVVPQDMGFTSSVDVWLPLAPDNAHESRGNRNLRVLGRLAPGVTLEQLATEMDVVAKRLARDFPLSNEGWHVRTTRVHDWIVGSEADPPESADASGLRFAQARFDVTVVRGRTRSDACTCPAVVVVVKELLVCRLVAVEQPANERLVVVVCQVRHCSAECDS